MAELPPLSRGRLPRCDGTARGLPARAYVPAVAARPAVHSLAYPRHDGTTRIPVLTW